MFTTYDFMATTVKPNIYQSQTQETNYTSIITKTKGTV